MADNRFATVADDDLEAFF